MNRCKNNTLNIIFTATDRNLFKFYEPVYFRVIFLKMLFTDQKNFILARNDLPMFLHFNFKTILITLIYSILAMNASSDKSDQHVEYQKLIQTVIKDLQDILLKFDCYSFTDNGKFEFIFISGIPSMIYSNRSTYFFSKPVLTPDQKSQKNPLTELTIMLMLNTLNTLRRGMIIKNPSVESLKTQEHFILDQMNNALFLIRVLVKNTNYIKTQSDVKLRENKIRGVRAVCSKLYNSLLVLRCLNYGECVFIRNEIYDFGFKLELASELYSMAFEALQDFSDLINS